MGIRRLHREGLLSLEAFCRAGAVMPHTTKAELWNIKVGGAMMDRCFNKTTPRYSNYGGRGITVCSEWANSFETFLSDMGQRPAGTSLDRKCNNEGYSKRNCRWATDIEQARNTRSNRTITIDGITRCVSEWAVEMGVKRGMIKNRLMRGWDEVAAVITPACSKRYYRKWTTASG